MTANNDFPDRDHKDALRRFKQITKILSDYFISAEWQDGYRREEADRFQRYLERRAAGGGYHAKTERDLWDWLSIHGQDFEYVTEGKVTSMICHLARRSAVADVIRERRRGVSDRRLVAKHEADYDKMQLQNARRFMGPARKSAEAAS